MIILKLVYIKPISNGIEISKNFDTEINKYSYNWTTGGQFAEKNNKKKIC